MLNPVTTLPGVRCISRLFSREWIETSKPSIFESHARYLPAIQPGVD